MSLTEPAVQAQPEEDSRALDFKVVLGGSPLSGEEQANVLALEVDTAVNRPDVCRITFRPLLAGDGLEQPNLPANFTPGKTLEVSQQGTALFGGEVTAVEYEYVAEQTTIVLTAHDKRHRLYRRQSLASFLNVSVGDVVKKLAGNAGVAVTASGKLPTSVHPYLVHPECSSGEWLERLLGEAGAVTLWEAGKMWAGPLADHKPAPVEIRFSAEVDRYRFRASCDGQHTEVRVQAWDYKKKEAFVGAAAASVGRSADVPASSAPPIRATVDRDAKLMSSADVVRVRSAAMTAGHANTLAKALSAAALDATVQLEARTIGNRLLRAGGLINAKQVPAAFAGTYRLSAVRHLLADGEYWTEISCHGASDGSLASTLGGAGSGTGSAMTPVPGITSVAVAIVTNNKDPENLGRVKVKLPWLPSPTDIESDWMRVMAMGAGPDRGWFWLPEVNDEVLVAFEHGDIRRPFVLGGLWNGKDKPPLATSAAVAGDGKVSRRYMKTRTGHILDFNDSPDAPGIILITKSGKMKMTFDDKTSDFKLETQHHVIVENRGDLTVTTRGNIDIKANGNVSLSGNQVTIEAKSNLDLKAGASAKVAANASLELTGTASAKLSGTGGTEVSSPAITQVKGVLVKIN